MTGGRGRRYNGSMPRARPIFGAGLAAPFALGAALSASAATVAPLSPAKPPVPSTVLAPTGTALALPPALSAPALGPLPAAAPAPSAAEPIPASSDRLALSPSAGVYERRGVGVLVVDMKNSTDLYLTLGNRRARELVAGALDFAEETSARFDGAVIRRLGDGHLIAFPNLEKALQAGIAVQSGLDAWRRQTGAPPLELHAAVHEGRVLVDAAGARPGVYGRTVERALALSAESRGGDVALDPALVSRLEVERRARDVALESGPRALLLRPTQASDPGRPLGSQPRLATTRFENAAILFASLVDWAEAYDRFGKRDAHATTKAFYAHVAAAVRRGGGAVVKSEGEMVMASFPSAADAVRAAVEMQETMDALRRSAPLGALAAARVGVSYGRVLREDTLEGPDYFGNRVNAAARLMRLARPGEVFVSGAAIEDPAAARLLAGAQRETVPLKGFSRPVPAFRLSPESAPPSTR